MLARDIGFSRLSNQRIARDQFATPEDAVRWMGALQAQDYMQAVWGIGLRTTSKTLAAVEEAIEAGKIIRTWPMRGTLHFIVPEDVRWRLKLSASRILAGDKRRMAQLELSIEIMHRCQDLFCDALCGGKRLTRPELMDLLENAGISTQKQRGYHILWYLSQSGVICLGPMQGKQQTFVLLDEWVPDARDLPRDEALAELTRRYFSSHGPASVYDLAWWAGITVTDARRGLEIIQSELVSDTIDGTQYWFRGAMPAPGNEKNPGIFLLPGFDEYLLGYKDRSAVLAEQFAQRIVPGNNGVFRAMLVIEGQVVGTWKRTIKKKSVGIALHPFIPLTHLEDQVLAAAYAYADFVGLSPAIQIVSEK